MADQGIISLVIAGCNSSGFVRRKVFFCTALREMHTLILYGCYNAGGALCTWPTVNSRQFPFTCCSIWKNPSCKNLCKHTLSMYFTVLVNAKHVTFYTRKHMRHGKALLSSYIFGLWNDKKWSLNGDEGKSVICVEWGEQPQLAW